MNTCVCPIAEGSTLSPELPAFFDYTTAKDVSFDELEQRVRCIVQQLQEMRVGRGERVALLGSNSLNTV